ncbi:Unknown protein sequence [Pseudomonas amygdali pv. lachrymans]|uniref:Uncharacterized protein n=1 Tax=Pseudomonas amygdali pv. lachrymans TaxID=53707 RepID=A0ABR5L0U9_PSEAV|nr:Unknown protein sequence [Pseudomonas amygdali pv. lachrymans]KPC21978.1 Unknown protein sequence [Pseudomonas amygdali pv. lachrymans]
MGYPDGYGAFAVNAGLLARIDAINPGRKTRRLQVAAISIAGRYI